MGMCVGARPGFSTEARARLYMQIWGRRFVRVCVCVCSCTHQRMCVCDCQTLTWFVCACVYACACAGSWAHEHMPAQSLAHVCERLVVCMLFWSNVCFYVCLLWEGRWRLTRTQQWTLHMWVWAVLFSFFVFDKNTTTNPGHVSVGCFDLFLCLFMSESYFWYMWAYTVICGVHTVTITHKHMVMVLCVCVWVYDWAFSFSKACARFHMQIWCRSVRVYVCVWTYLRTQTSI